MLESTLVLEGSSRLKRQPALSVQEFQQVPGAGFSTLVAEAVTGALVLDELCPRYTLCRCRGGRHEPHLESTILLGIGSSPGRTHSLLPLSQGNSMSEKVAPSSGRCSERGASRSVTQARRYTKSASCLRLRHSWTAWQYSSYSAMMLSPVSQRSLGSGLSQ